MDWSQCFPAGARVMALPNWQRPRLYLTQQSMPRRWGDSALFPAMRWRAKGYRLMLRARAAAGLAQSRVAKSQIWLVGQFVQDILPPVGSITVLVGRPGAHRKMTIQLRQLCGKVCGYLKWAQSPAESARLRHEFEVLCHLPRGVGPLPIKLAALGEGLALLTAPIHGAAVTGAAAPPPGVSRLMELLKVSEPRPFEQHPWVRRMCLGETDSQLEQLLQPLARRCWPVVIGHGDLAPWNLLIDQESQAIRAVDWEAACLEGFPYLDLAHYLLQSACLVQRWRPRKTMRYAAAFIDEFMAEHEGPAQLQAAMGVHLVRLSALLAYRGGLEDGFGPDDRNQAWRREIFEAQL